MCFSYFSAKYVCIVIGKAEKSMTAQSKGKDEMSTLLPIFPKRPSSKTKLVSTATG